MTELRRVDQRVDIRVRFDPGARSDLDMLLATPVRKDVEVADDIKPLVTTDFDRIWFADEVKMASMQKEWLDRYTREIQS